MKVQEDAQFRADLIQKIRDREFSIRTGVHSSDLIYCLNKQALRKREPVPDSDAQVLLFSLGYASQRWLTGSNKDADPITVDGITVTPDALVCPSCGCLVG